MPLSRRRLQEIWPWSAPISKKTLSALDEKIRQAATDQEKFDLHREKMRIKGELTRI
jgi:hypothetical protein